MEYLNSDVAKEMFGQEGLFRRVAAHADVIDHSKEITKLLSQLPNASAVWVEVEPGLRYLATKEFDSETLEAFARGTRGALGISWISRDPADSPAYYPLCLSIRDPEGWYRFVSGEYAIMIGVDEEVARKLAHESGTDLRFERDDATFPLRVVFPLASHGPVEVKIGWHFTGRLFADFLSLRWFVLELTNRRAPVAEYMALGDSLSSQEH